MKIYPGQIAAFASADEFYKPSFSYKILILTLAVCYGAILAGLPLEAFKDRANYLVYASDSWEILLRYLERGPLELLSNEPLWLLINLNP